MLLLLLRKKSSSSFAGSSMCSNLFIMLNATCVKMTLSEPRLVTNYKNESRTILVTISQSQTMFMSHKPMRCESLQFAVRYIVLQIAAMLCCAMQCPAIGPKVSANKGSLFNSLAAVKIFLNYLL